MELLLHLIKGIGYLNLLGSGFRRIWDVEVDGLVVPLDHAALAFFEVRDLLMRLLCPFAICTLYLYLTLCQLLWLLFAYTLLSFNIYSVQLEQMLRQILFDLLHLVDGEIISERQISIIAIKRQWWYDWPAFCCWFIILGHFTSLISYYYLLVFYIIFMNINQYYSYILFILIHPIYQNSRLEWRWYWLIPHLMKLHPLRGRACRCRPCGRIGYRFRGCRLPLYILISLTVPFRASNPGWTSWACPLLRVFFLTPPPHRPTCCHSLASCSHASWYTYLDCCQ